MEPGDKKTKRRRKKDKKYKKTKCEESPLFEEVVRETFRVWQTKGFLRDRESQFGLSLKN